MSAGNRPVMASSPPSSNEATHDTPSTSMTVFSPEAGMSTGKNKSKAKTTLMSAPLARINTTLASGNDDVFLTAPAGEGTRQLSPIADEFTPSAAAPMAETEATAYNVIAPVTHPLGAGPLVQNSIPDFGPRVGINQQQTANTAGVIGRPTNAVVDSNQLAVAMQGFNIVTFQDVNVREGVFSFDEGVARTYAIENCVDFTLPTILRLLNTGNIPTAGVDSSQLATRRKIVMSFDNARDARKAIIAIHANPLPYVSVSAYTARELAAHRGNSNGALCSMFEGQAHIFVYWDQATLPGLSANAALATLRAGLSRFGEIKALHSMPFNQHRIREFRVEFYDINSAAAIINYTQGQPYQVDDNLCFEAVPYVPPQFAAPPPQQVSITGRSMVPADNQYTQLVGTLTRDDGHSRRRGAHGQYTRIDVGRIRNGHDVRTTVMLRNIPNRVTQEELKDIMDETSLGDYDFMYLRIDFANTCNVGYAFINFTDPFAIIPFAEARQGQRWTIFNSTKVAEISYATIQGRENLIAKFRNSSVMLEAPNYRPKLFFSGNHANAGLEEPFPTPDNVQKMRRSIENAETVGLCPTGLYNPMRGIGRNGRRAAPPARVLRSVGPVYAGVQRQQVQAPSVPLLPAPTTPATGSGATISPAYTQSGGSTGSAPSSSVSSHFSHSNMVDTSSPSDPFFGRADRLRLFAPRQGQVLREEQRRRVSQFDRGTPGAQLELQQSTGPAPSFGGNGAHADFVRYSGYQGN